MDTDQSQQGGTPGGAQRFKRADDAGLARIRAVLERERERFVAEIHRAVRAQVPALAEIDDDVLVEAIRFDYGRALDALADGGAGRPGPAAAARLPGDCDTADVAAARRVGIRTSWELVRADPALAGLDEAARLEGLYAVWEWADAIQAEEAALRWRAELRDVGGNGDDERDRFLRALLQGTLAPGEVRSRGSAYGLLPGGRYLAVRGRAPGAVDVRALVREVEATGGQDGFGALVGTIDGDLCGVVSRIPRIGIVGIVGVGFEADLPRLGESYRMATRALETAVAFDLAGVVTIDDLSLRPAILAESHLGDRLVRRYLEPLSALGEFGTTVEATVRSYLSHGMRIDESARSLFIHPNTLRHRLDRFQQLTGADLRRTQDVAELWWALERRRLDQPAA